MAWDEEEQDTTTYFVVVNHEEQYSIWPDYKEIPNGWHAAGKSGPKKDCLDYINEVWTDMRPLSLRKQMAEMEKQHVSTASASLSSKKTRKNGQNATSAAAPSKGNGKSTAAKKPKAATPKKSRVH